MIKKQQPCQLVGGRETLTDGEHKDPNDELRRQSGALPPSLVGEERDGGVGTENWARKPVLTTKYNTVWASVVAQVMENLPTTQETWV